jgi:riboflavin transporter FmnP
MKRRTREIVLGALLSALAFVSMYFIQIPLFPSAPYLQFDPSEIFSLFAAFFISPTMGVLVTLVKVILFYLTKQESGIIGSVMNFLAVAPFVFFSSLLFRKIKKTGIILSFSLSIIFGTLIRILFMIPTNLLFVPIYTGLPLKQTWIYIYTINIPFNIVVSLINGILFILLSFALSKLPEVKKEFINVK